MIAVSSKGRSFRALATYLASGRTGQERERVAWSTARNLPTNDPELAGKIMRATAERSTRVEQPVYHLVLSFDPNDAPARATMERVADRVLARIELHEHQAVIVAHRDREHAHVHVLVNRVHPESGLAWEYSFDYRAIQEVLREEERALGVRQVPGRYRDRGIAHDTDRGMDGRMDIETGVGGEAGAAVGRVRGSPPELDGHGSLREPGEPVLDRSVSPISAEEAAPNRDAEGAQAERRTRRAHPAFLDSVRARLSALRATRSWGEFEATLAAHGLRVESRGQGLVITDGEQTVKASAIARDFARGRLEARFGKAWPTHLAERVAARDRGIPGGIGGLDGAVADRVPGLPPSTNTVAALRRQLEMYEHVSTLFGEHYAATRALHAAQATQAQMNAGGARVRAASESFERKLRSVYRDPAAARAAFEKVAVEEGIEPAVQAMRARPERFGALLMAEELRAFGLVRRASDAPAKQSALGAAVRGREAWQARLELPALTEQHELREVMPRAAARERMARDAVARGPDRRRLEREIGHALRRLLPHEIEDLRRAVTRPQFAVAMKLRKVAREALLGREVPEQ